MGLWQNCKCKSCGHEWEFEIFSMNVSYKNDYNVQYCEKCRSILEEEKRKQYFDNNHITLELEEYRYALECIMNSDGWIIEDNPLCTIESAYAKCVKMAEEVLNKYK